jgi:septal ring factor EnvC (AmiA/AmiB activator)
VPPARLRLRLRRAGALALAGLVVAAPATAAPGPGELSRRISAAGARERQLRGRIQGESQVIAGYQGRIQDLQRRLAAIELSLAGERAELLRIQGELRTAHARLAILRRELVEAKAVLARQVVALYEAPTPDIVTVVAQSHGFAGLLEQVGGMRSIARQNAQATHRVIRVRTEVAAQVKRLAEVEGRHQRIADGMIIQRDQVAQLKLAVVNRQLVVSRSRARDSGRLGRLRARRRALEGALQRIQAREAAAAAATSTAGDVMTSAPPPSSGGGGYGFFPAAGTNYSAGQEPEIAARLDRMAKALGLHLIGLSGYRTPSHSVEVGGFPNDPHTRGQASDTPGVEGVPEATLNRFGLTRPFGGAAEANHIQLS